MLRLAAAVTLGWWLVGDLDTFWQKQFTTIILLLKCILGNGLESLLDVNGFLGRSLEVWDVALALAPSGSSLGGHNTLSLEIDLVTQNNEWEVIGISWSSLDQELITPAIQILESLGNIDIEDQDTAISSSVESNTQTLESFLTSSIPDLHSDQSVIDHNFLCQEISANGGLVLVAEFLVHILVHQGSFTDT
jgi:hypothetical protein